MIFTHLSRLVPAQVKLRGEQVVLRHRDDATKTWIPTTWNQFADKVKKLASAMASFGIKEFDRCAIFSQNKPEGLIVDFALYENRAVAVPLYATSSVEQVTYILNDSESQIIFVGEQYQYDIAYIAIKSTPTVKKLVIFDESVIKKQSDDTSVYFKVFLETGQSAEAEQIVAQRMEAAQDEDLANLVDTS